MGAASGLAGAAGAAAFADSRTTGMDAVVAPTTVPQARQRIIPGRSSVPHFEQVLVDAVMDSYSVAIDRSSRPLFRVMTDGQRFSRACRLAPFFDPQGHCVSHSTCLFQALLPGAREP
jgi:hypothetical protein